MLGRVSRGESMEAGLAQTAEAVWRDGDVPLSVPHGGPDRAPEDGPGLERWLKG
jgi:hypothetical protein